MSDFWRQALLSVIDKGLLGGVGLGLGYFVNRRLERFRSGRALESEFLKERTRRLDELYVAMLEVEATGMKYAALELERIETNKSKPGPFKQPRTPETIDAGAKFKIASETLARMAAHYRPWIGDRLHAGGIEYGKVVKNNVSEQTIDGSHDIDRIGQLDERTSQLQEEIMAAIREGASNAATGKISGERSRARSLALAPAADRKKLVAPERS